MLVLPSVVLLLAAVVAQEEGEGGERYGGGRRPIGAGVSDGAIAYPEEHDRPAPAAAAGHGLRVLAGWKQLDFEFPDDATRRAMIDNGQFVPVNNMIIDVDVYDKRGGGRLVFVTVPRTRPGVPVTLTTIGERRNAQGDAPLLRPFPDWQANNAFFSNDCDSGLTSVFRIFVESGCGWLWALDCGVINANNGNPSMPCPPKLVIYDLNDNNRLIGSFPVPTSLLEPNSMLITVVVERLGGCAVDGEAFAYVADSMGGKLLVFGLRERQWWRANSILFAPFPDQATFNVSGVLFDVPAGIFGLALGPRPRGGAQPRRLYFHGIASVRQSWVETDVLRNRTLWQASMNAAPRAFRLSPGTRRSQSVVSTMTERGTLLFTLTESNEIASWDSRTPFGGDYIRTLLKDDEKLQFNVGIKVYKDKLYLTSNRIQNFVTNQVKTSEVNYRVMELDLRRHRPASADRFDADAYAPNSDSVDRPEAPPPLARDPARPVASV